jgi:hypothetical protein
MTLIDSLDSVLMLSVPKWKKNKKHSERSFRYSYTGFPEKGWALLRRTRSEKGKLIVRDIVQPDTVADRPHDNDVEDSPKTVKSRDNVSAVDEQALPEAVMENEEDAEERKINVQLKNASMSTLGILLTTISILLAFTCVTFHFLRVLCPPNHLPYNWYAEAVYLS